MSTNRSFSAMLNEYLNFDLLNEEHIRRDYIMKNVERDNDWKGGPYIVPFKGGDASSWSHGSLTPEADITENTYVRGSIDDYREIWGTMKFHGRDLIEHDAVSGQPTGKVNEQTFLKNLPGQIEDFMDSGKEVISTQILSGAHFAKLVADATANDGIIEVDHPERFTVDQKVVVDDGDSSAITAYVARTGGIDINNSKIKLVTTLGGSTVVNFSGNNMTVAQGAKCYFPGAETSTNPFTSLHDQLLSAANGGSASLFGKTKLNYPYLQAVNIDGQDWTKANCLERLFDANVKIRKLGKVGMTEVVCSYTLLAAVEKIIEAGAGAYKHVDTEVHAHDWMKITISGPKGRLTLVGVNEQPDELAYFLNWKGLQLASNGNFRIQKDPDTGKMYYTVRSTSGYTYIVDISFYGEFIAFRPSTMGVVYNLDIAD